MNQLNKSKRAIAARAAACTKLDSVSQHYLLQHVQAKLLFDSGVALAGTLIISTLGYCVRQSLPRRRACTQIRSCNLNRSVNLSVPHNLACPYLVSPLVARIALGRARAPEVHASRASAAQCGTQHISVKRIELPNTNTAAASPFMCRGETVAYNNC